MRSGRGTDEIVKLMSTTYNTLLVGTLAQLFACQLLQRGMTPYVQTQVNATPKTLIVGVEVGAIE
jgi:hypothetical protein